MKQRCRNEEVETLTEITIDRWTDGRRQTETKTHRDRQRQTETDKKDKTDETETDKTDRSQTETDKTDRSRERERDIYIYIHISAYIDIDIDRQRERGTEITKQDLKMESRGEEKNGGGVEEDSVRPSICLSVRSTSLFCF